MDKPPVQLASLFRFVISFGGQEKVRSLQAREVIIGRASPEATPDIDLSSDTNVSRRHARLWQENGVYWIEDLGSRGGTLVNGIDIKAHGRQPVPPVGALIGIGNTSIRVEIPSDPSEAFPLITNSELVAFGIAATVEAEATVDSLLNGTDRTRLPLPGLLGLPLVLAGAASLHELLRGILEQSLDLITPAQSGAVVLSDRTEGLHLTSFSGIPLLNDALIRRTLLEKKSLQWQNSSENSVSASGLYVPLQWNGKKVGAICLNGSPNTFRPYDLTTLTLAGRYGACAISKVLNK